MAKTDYRFIQKDSIIDVIRTAMSRRGNISPEHIRRTAYEAGISPSTIDNWLNGDTRRPLSITTRFALEALGVSVRYEQDGKQIREVKPDLISVAEQRAILAKDKEREEERKKKTAAKK